MEAKARRTYVSVKEFLETVDGRLSKNLVYAAIRDGTIPSCRIGRRILVPSDALDQALETQNRTPDRANDGNQG